LSPFFLSCRQATKPARSFMLLCKSNEEIVLISFQSANWMPVKCFRCSLSYVRDHAVGAICFFPTRNWKCVVPVTDTYLLTKETSLIF
jgi:hypothetical protein